MLAAVHISTSTLDLISLVMPVFVGFLVKRYHARWFKTVVMLTLTATLALAKALLAKGGILDMALVNDWGRSTLITVVSYLGLVDPLGLGNLAPGKGIPGPTPSLPDGTQPPTD